jgi:signal transduction histidine kinase
MNRFDRVLWIRHLAICAGAVLAYLLRSELRIGYTALWIVGIGAWLNAVAYAFRTREALARFCLVASPVIGVGSWAALCAVTGGYNSPFVAGLWLEIVLSALHLSPKGIAGVAAGTVAALWLQQFVSGLYVEAWIPLLLLSGFLLGTGVALSFAAARWKRSHEQLSKRHVALGGRLERLERELADERALSSLGESAARLAHGHKNAIHSLRGFVSLIEPKLGEGKGTAAALEGLKAAIDDLEQLAHLTLDTARERRNAGPERARSRPVADLGHVLGEVAASHPGSHWQLRSDGSDPELRISSSDFVEVMRALVVNSVEAMHGRGDGWVELRSNGSLLYVTVRDEGEGFPAEVCEQIFERGFTTKRQGSGYGLYLARKLVQDNGGRLTARPGDRKGAIFELALPLAVAAGSKAAMQ